MDLLGNDLPLRWWLPLLLSLSLVAVCAAHNLLTRATRGRHSAAPPPCSGGGSVRDDEETDGEEGAVLVLEGASSFLFALLHRLPASAITPSSPSASLQERAGTRRLVAVDLLRRHACVLVRTYFSPAEVAGFGAALGGLVWEPQRRATLLGLFDFVRFAVGSEPSLLRPYVQRLMAAVPEVSFTHAWVQRYGVGHFVPVHRDPGTYLWCVVIGVFGDFVGAVSTIEGVQESGLPGDVFVLRAKLDSLPMPLHEVSPVVWGIRYVLLLTAVDSATLSPQKPYHDS